MPQLENIEAIEKCLWSVADTLRANSNYASNKCFMPVTESIEADYTSHVDLASIRENQV